MAPVPLPQVPLSQSAPVWQTLVVPLAQIPSTAEVPVPQEPLSQSVFWWHVPAVVVHVPAVELVPVPQVPPMPHAAFE